MLELDFGVVGLEELVDSFGEDSSLFGPETAVFLIEISESAETGFLLELFKLFLRPAKDGFDILSYKVGVVVGVKLDDSEQVEQLGELLKLKINLH